MTCPLLVKRYVETSSAFLDTWSLVAATLNVSVEISIVSGAETLNVVVETWSFV